MKRPVPCRTYNETESENPKMPSSYPFPSLAALCLSLYTSDRHVERLPVIVEVQPWERAEIVPHPISLDPVIRAHACLSALADRSPYCEGI